MIAVATVLLMTGDTITERYPATMSLPEMVDDLIGKYGPHTHTTWSIEHVTLDTHTHQCRDCLAEIGCDTPCDWQGGNDRCTCGDD